METNRGRVNDQPDDCPLEASSKASAVRIIAKQVTVLIHDTIHRATQLGLRAEGIEVADDTLFMRNGDVYAQKTEGSNTVYGFGQVGRMNVKGDVHVRQLQGPKRRVVHGG